MSHFKAKMHQTLLGSLQRSPNPLARFKGACYSGERKGGEGKDSMESGGRGGEGREE